jgi:hypothetical protein
LFKLFQTTSRGNALYIRPHTDKHRCTGPALARPSLAARAHCISPGPLAKQDLPPPVMRKKSFSASLLLDTFSMSTLFSHERPRSRRAPLPPQCQSSRTHCQAGRGPDFMVRRVLGNATAGTRSYLVGLSRRILSAPDLSIAYSHRRSLIPCPKSSSSSSVLRDDEGEVPTSKP